MLSPALFCLSLGSLCGLMFLHNSSTLISNSNLLYLWLVFIILNLSILLFNQCIYKLSKLSYIYKYIVAPANKKSMQYIFIFVLSSCLSYSYGCYRSNMRLAYQLSPSLYNKVLNLNIKISTLPNIIYTENKQIKGIKFQAKVLNNNFNFENILINAYANIANLEVGDILNVDVKLKPPYSTQNPYLFDYEFYLFSNNIHALGTIDIEKAQKIKYITHTGFFDSTWIEQIRFYIQQQIKPFIQSLNNQNILLALIIGNQAQINNQQWQLFNQTGIGHLISISGLHITMLAFITSYIPLIFIRLYPNILLYINKKYVCAGFGLLCAGLYTLISGLQIPAQRTWIMLCFMFIFYKHFTLAASLTLAALCIMYFDPWCIGSASFWLSFIAVSLLIFIGQIIIKQGSIKTKFWWAAIASQLAISVAMLPICILIFGQFSLVSPLANALAIPLVSYIVAPLSLLASLLSFVSIFDLLTKYCFEFSNYILQLTINWCTYLASIPMSFGYAAKPNILLLILASIGVICLLLPYIWRWYGVIFLVPIFMHKNFEPQIAKFSALFFDVGQGSSILISTANHYVLFDTGPANFDNSSIAADKTIIPILHRIGITKLDTLIVSHPDKDHSAGLPSIIKEFAIDNLWVGMQTNHKLLTSLYPTSKQKNLNLQSCTPTTWEYDKVQFSILYPFADNDFNQKTNYSSCVLKVSIGAHSMLLTADIEHEQEIMLVNNYADLLSSDILLAPHHGSKTSSSIEFLQKVNPSNIIIQNGFLNMYKHPHQNILQRYKTFNTNIWRTDMQGAIQVNMDKHGYNIDAQRLIDKRYWRIF